MARRNSSRGLFASFKHFTAYVAVFALLLTIAAVFITSFGINNSQNYGFFNRAAGRKSLSPGNPWGNAVQTNVSGSPGHIVTDRSNEFQLARNQTIEAWVKYSNIEDHVDIITKSSDTTMRQYGFYSFVLESNGSLEYWISLEVLWEDCRSPFPFFAYAPISADAWDDWHHIAAVIQNDNKVILYLDGQPLTLSIPGTFRNTCASSANPLLVAGDNASNYLQGIVDEVRISSTARYSGAFTPPYLPFKNDEKTLLLYHFDEPLGYRKVTDSSKFGHHGKFVGNLNLIQSTVPSISTHSN